MTKNEDDIPKEVLALFQTSDLAADLIEIADAAGMSRAELVCILLTGGLPIELAMKLGPKLEEKLGRLRQEKVIQEFILTTKQRREGIIDIGVTIVGVSHIEKCECSFHVGTIDD